MTAAPPRIVLAVLVVAVLVGKAGRRLASGQVDTLALPQEQAMAIVVLTWSALTVAAVLGVSRGIRARRSDNGAKTSGIGLTLLAFAMAGVASELLTHGLGLYRHSAISWAELLISWTITSIDVLLPYTVAYTWLTGAVEARTGPGVHLLAGIATLIGYLLLVSMRHALPLGPLWLLIVTGIGVAWLVRMHRKGVRSTFLP